MSQRILEAVLAELEAGRPAVLARITDFRGSVPRKDSPYYAFFTDGRQLGTVGGGCLDVFAQRLAAQVMEQGGSLTGEQHLDSEDAQESGLICGGRVTVEARRLEAGAQDRALLQAMLADPAVQPPRLLVFGGGHVGLAAARIAHEAGFAVSVIDDREEYASALRFPFAERCLAGEVSRAGELPALGGRDAVLIATRGHAYDLEALAWALRCQAGFIGLLGSRRKRDVIARKLIEMGIGADEFQSRCRCPVGLEIGAVTPEEIAVAAVAQLIAFRRDAL